MTNQQEKQTKKTEETTSNTTASNKQQSGQKDTSSPQTSNDSQQNGGKKPAPDKKNENKEEFEQQILDIARVTRVMAGGKRMNFRACVAVGDRNGKIGVGLAKGADVAIAVNKAANQAKKDMVSVPLVYETIPHEIKYKYGAAEILFKPSKQGRGIIAGGIVRVILELSGIKNVTSKILGTNNKMNNAKCTVEALRNLKRVDVSRLDGKKENKNTSAKAEQTQEESSKDSK